MYSQEALQRALQERQGPANMQAQQGGMPMMPPELMQMLGNAQPAVQPIGNDQGMDPMQLIQMLLMQGQ